jgi:rRNA-processing protein FCF1
LRQVVLDTNVLVDNDCPWPEFFEHWSDRRPDIGDAAILALAVTKRYDSLATFDRDLSKRAKTFGVTSYW